MQLAYFFVIFGFCWIVGGRRARTDVARSGSYYERRWGGDMVKLGGIERLGQTRLRAKEKEL
jgi:hypothetical protein